MYSETLKSQSHIITIGERSYELVDTPGFFDTSLSDEEMTTEITNLILKCAYGLQAVILVTEYGRMTDENRKAIKWLTDFFGEGVNSTLILVFTKVKSELAKDRELFGAGLINDFPTRSGRRQVNPMKEIVLAANNRWIISPSSDSSNSFNDPPWLREAAILVKQISSLSEPYTTNMFEYIRKEREKFEEDSRLADEAHKNRMRELEEKNERLHRLELEDKEKEKMIMELKLEAQKIKADAEIEKLKLRYENQLKEERMAREAAESNNGGCFALDTLVTLESGARVPLSETTLGDRILCCGSDGRMKYSELYLFMDYATEKTVEYRHIRFTKPDGTKGGLYVTPDHHVFVNNTIDFAQNLSSTSIVQIFYEGALVSATVDDVSTEWRQGFVSVLTWSGTIIANDVLCSCFCEVPPSPGIQVLGRMAFVPLWLFTRVYPSTGRSEDVHPYVQALVDIILTIKAMYDTVVSMRRDVCIAIFMACVAMMVLLMQSNYNVMRTSYVSHIYSRC